MTKDFFGWLIATCRLWAAGSSYDNKTSRAKYGLSLVCGFYIIGFTFNSALLIEVEGFSGVREVMYGVIITSYLLPLFLLKKFYTKESIERYIGMYEQLDKAGKAKRQLVAVLFCFIGWFVLAGPFLIG
jgi:hypothetical protein